MTAGIRDFLRLEAASGILLVIAAALAMGVENSAFKPLYDHMLGTRVEFRVGGFALSKPLLLWINDGLMAVFFFLVGLELKREFLRGELSTPTQIVLPAAGALGGMLVPAAIYAIINLNDPAALRGWAIPAATDIAFALGVLSLLGSRVPGALKVFLMTLAIIDDIGAILLIAVFYTSDLSSVSFGIAGAALLALALLNRAGVDAIPPYVLIGLVLWTAVLKSGVHATLAGVLLAFFIPLRATVAGRPSPLERLEHGLHPWVAFLILPLFAFANAGVSLPGLSFDSLTAPVPLGIATGLFIGKQLGIFACAWAVIVLGLTRLPEGVRWIQLYGVAVLCGIGFTMSLFISSLAFETGDPARAVDDRLGILAGSLLSAVCGYLILRCSLPRTTRSGAANVDTRRDGSGL